MVRWGLGGAFVLIQGIRGMLMEGERGGNMS